MDSTPRSRQYSSPATTWASRVTASNPGWAFSRPSPPRTTGSRDLDLGGLGVEAARVDDHPRSARKRRASCSAVSGTSSKAWICARERLERRSRPFAHVRADVEDGARRLGAHDREHAMLAVQLRHEAAPRRPCRDTSARCAAARSGRRSRLPATTETALAWIRSLVSMAGRLDGLLRGCGGVGVAGASVRRARLAAQGGALRKSRARLTRSPCLRSEAEQAGSSRSLAGPGAQRASSQAEDDPGAPTPSQPRNQPSSERAARGSCDHRWYAQLPWPHLWSARTRSTRPSSS